MKKIFYYPDIEKAASYDTIVFNCKNCNKEVSIQKRRFSENLCRKCKLSKKAEEGVYKNCKEKTKKTCLEKYGVDHPLKSEEVKEKSKKTCLEKYGSEYTFQSEEVKEKIKESLIDRFGVPYTVLTEESRQKGIETKKKNFGENPGKNPIIQEKTKKTNREKFGVDYAPQNSEVLEKILKNRTRKYFYGPYSFDSSWELYYTIWLEDFNIDFEFHPQEFFTFEVDGQIKKYYPDFKIGDKYIELKGDHFINKDGTWKCPFDRTLDHVFEAKRQCCLKNNVEIITDISEYRNYVEEKYGKDFKVICGKNYIDNFLSNLSEFPYPKENLKSPSSIIRHFHKSIWTAHKKNYQSPVEAWGNKELMRKVYLNRLKYKKSINLDILRHGLSVSMLAPKVSVFKHTVAENLIKKYLNEFTEIFDPFSGFSGRMIGAYLTDKKYIGQDLNEIHVKESNEIIDFLNASNRLKIIQKDLFESEGEYESLFTCPPYSDKEIWGEEVDFRSCDDWISECLKRFKCKKYLFVVDETEKYKDFVVDKIVNKSHFQKNKELVILIQK